MCVIAYAPPGVSITDAVIERMFLHNPDGAGIMWKPYDGGDVKIKKGFMDVEALKDAWASIPIECEKAIHCRIATSGKVSVDCCHPFPVREYAEQMRASEDHAPIVIMHNGVFGFCEPKGGLNSTYSDSMLFASRYLYPLRKELSNPAVQRLLEEAIGTSRLLIFNKDTKAMVLGDWEEDEGVYFSNLNHECLYGRWRGCGYGYTYGPGDYVVASQPQEEYYYTLCIDAEKIIDELSNLYAPNDQTLDESDNDGFIEEQTEEEVLNALHIGSSPHVDYVDGPTVDLPSKTVELTVWSSRKLKPEDIEKASGLTLLDMTEVDAFGSIIEDTVTNDGAEK